MPSLFRPEALDGQRQAWLGSVQIVRPVPLTVLTALVVVAATATGAFLFEGRYTRRAHVTGYLVPDRGIVRLMPPEAATVVESHAREGQRVRQGEVLFVLSMDRTTDGGDAQAAVQASLAARERSLDDAARQRTQLQRQEDATLARRIADLQAELAQLDAETALQQQRLAIAQQALQRYESLKDDQFVSPAQVQAKGEEVLAVKAQIQSLARQRAALQRDIGAVSAQRRELPLRAQAEQGRIERDRAELAQASAEAAARRRIVIRAPQDGIVTAVLALRGQGVSPGAPLASLLPADATLQAELYAPSSAVGFLRPAQAVQLRYQAFPYQKFGHQAGRVVQVSRTPLQAAELAALPLPEALKSAPSAEPLYRITVALSQQSVQAFGAAQPLAPGMQLDADVLLEQRRLIEWIFEPLLSVTGRV